MFTIFTREITIKILYDHQVFSQQQYGGVSRLFYELIKGILPKPQAHIYFLQSYYINRYPLDQLRQYMAFYEGRRVPALPHISLLLQPLNNSMFRTKAPHFHVQVYHPSNYSSIVSRWRTSPLILTANDMIPELFPQHFPDIKKRLKTKLECLHRADRIMAISHTTCHDLHEFYNIPKNKIKVIYPGVPLPLPETATESNCTPGGRPFILYVGSRKQEYKNFINLLFAYGTTKSIHCHFDLVCFGGTSFTTAERRLMDKLNCDKTVFQLSGDDYCLASMYRHASAFVYPSLYEGFGLPTLEAQTYHCPTIASDIDVFKEILGDSASYFNPFNPYSIAQAMESVLYDDTFRASLVARGTENVTHYSWQNMTDEVYRLYETLIDGASFH